MNTGQIGIWADDTVNALQRIAVALEELVTLKQVEIEATVMRPDEEEDT
jgi:hypothetical protein